LSTLEHAEFVRTREKVFLDAFQKAAEKASQPASAQALQQAFQQASHRAAMAAAQQTSQQGTQQGAQQGAQQATQVVPPGESQGGQPQAASEGVPSGVLHNAPPVPIAPASQQMIQQAYAQEFGNTFQRVFVTRYHQIFRAQYAQTSKAAYKEVIGYGDVVADSPDSAKIKRETQERVEQLQRENHPLFKNQLVPKTDPFGQPLKPTFVNFNYAGSSLLHGDSRVAAGQAGTWGRPSASAPMANQDPSIQQVLDNPLPPGASGSGAPVTRPPP
jgi:hypothetical protein